MERRSLVVKAPLPLLSLQPAYSLRGAEQLDGGRPLRGRGLVVAQWYMAYKPLQSRATIMATRLPERLFGHSCRNRLDAP